MTPKHLKGPLRIALALAIVCISAGFARSQQFDPNLYAGMKWRLIGPFRGGRVLAVAGVAGQPNVYYFGAVGGGVWKTTDGGLVWKPLFDRQPIASIGAIAVAPSDPNVIYVGTGEADMRSDISFGDGVYKSTDAGETWRNVGLKDSRHIGRILVDPRNPDVALVAALGHAYGPNGERGVFRTADGGSSWQRVLYKDENTGAIDLSFAPDDSRIVYAALWRTRRPPWNTYAPLDGPGSGLYKSTDGGITWSQLAGGGLPSGEWGRIGIAVARGDHGNRVYASIDAKDAGLYRSDDAGNTWRRVGTDSRIRKRSWYFSGVTPDSQDPNVVYVANTSLYRSTDGGETFEATKGAPGGDDYHTLWIAPDDPRRMILGSDQGAAISVDGGNTWSSWYNQPTAQFYHVATDNRFPYYVYGAQQDSGTVAIASRSDYGLITDRDWYSTGGEESGYILPDPSDPDVVYGGGPAGVLLRFSRTTGQSQNISPWPASIFGGKYRFTWTSPLAFSPQDSHVLYFGSQYLFRTSDGGTHWEIISPDLTLNHKQDRKTSPSAAGADADSNTRSKIPSETHSETHSEMHSETHSETHSEIDDRAVIYTIAPSPARAGRIWIGTDNGLIQLTDNGGNTWRDVTPEGLPPWSRVSLIAASAFNAETAYAAIDRHETDDFRPYVFRTHDSGKTWQKISEGIPDRSYVNAVREDPARKGLLFAGTETDVYVSFDDGDRWQSLQLNLPVASVRDLAIQGNDLVIATHGRAFWILDDITPLRQLDSQVARSDAHLFAPAPAIRVRRDVNNDTPFPPETPAGANPPSGAVIDYSLKSEPQGEITLEILRHDGALVRRFSSEMKPAPALAQEPPDIPSYWFRPAQPLPNNSGMNRFVWDLRYSRPPTIQQSYTIAAVFGQDTPSLPEGPLALPGEYQVRLTVAGRTYSRPLVVQMDPRVKTAGEELAKQLDLQRKIGEALERNYQAYAQVRDLRSQLELLEQRLGNVSTAKGIVDAARELDQKTANIEGELRDWPARPTGLIGSDETLAALATAIGTADRAPTAQSYEVFEESLQELNAHLEQWQGLLHKELPALNALMREKKIPPIVVAPGSPEHSKPKAAAQP
jgi:photosystem II stability/assembly factor-like uncharacterized protein